MAKVVHASSSGAQVTNTHKMCAERTFLDSMQRLLERRGVPRRRMLTRGHCLVRNMTVERFRADATRGCSIPCAACRVELAKWNVRVTCFDERGEKFRGRVEEIEETFGPGKCCLCDKRR